MAKSRRGAANLIPAKKGEVRNPAGRPKNSISLARIVREAVDKNEQREILKSVAEQAKNGNIKAAEFIFDRIYGKPKTEVELTDSATTLNVQNNFTVDGKSVEELLRLRNEMLALMTQNIQDEDTFAEVVTE